MGRPAVRLRRRRSRDAVEPAGADDRLGLGDRGAAAARPARRRAGRHEAARGWTATTTARAVRAADRPPARRRAASWSSGCARSSSRARAASTGGSTGSSGARPRRARRARRSSPGPLRVRPASTGCATPTPRSSGSRRRDTDPSQVPFMTDHGVTSVDDLDLVAGKTALVWALLGGGRASSGVKGSAERLLPAAPERAGDPAEPALGCAGCRWSLSLGLRRAAGARRCSARLERAGVVRENYRGARAAGGARDADRASRRCSRWARWPRSTSWPTRTRSRPRSGAALVFVLGRRGAGPGRRPARRARAGRRGGDRGPARAARATRGRPRAGDFSTGMLKALGALGLALYVLVGRRALGRRVPGRRRRCWCSRTNLFNLLDLRPGRAGKAFVALGVVLTLGSWDTVRAAGARPLHRPGARAAAVRPARAGDARRRGLERARRRRRALARARARPDGRGGRARRARAFSLFTGSFARSARWSSGTLCCVV